MIVFLANYKSKEAAVGAVILLAGVDEKSERPRSHIEDALPVRDGGESPDDQYAPRQNSPDSLPGEEKKSNG